MFFDARHDAKQSWQRIPCTATHITLFIHAEGLAVYSSLSDALYGLEGYAAALFLRREQGEDRDTLLAELPYEQQSAAVRLLDQCDVLLQGKEITPQQYTPAIPYPAAPPIDIRQGCCYRLLDTRFFLTSHSLSLVPALHHHLAHLVCHDDAVNISPEIVIDLNETGGKILIFVNGEAVNQGLLMERLYPYLQDLMRIIAYQRLPYLLTLHSAALSKNGHCLLMPGASGAGKSTLTAALLTHGYQLHSDETTIINIDDFGIYSIPMALGQKKNSWALLDQLYPELASAPTHQRFDGQPVRYLVPHPEQRADHSRRPANTIIFPKYTPEGDGQLIPLSPLAALSQLDVSGYQVRDHLGVDKADKILNWLSGLRVYQLNYNHFAQAIEAIDELPELGDTTTNRVSRFD